MGTVTILGRTYQTAVLPDGSTRLADNLRYVSAGIGRWWNDLGEDDGKGAYYAQADLVALSSLLAGTGWRLDTQADTTRLIDFAYGPSYEPPFPRLEAFLAAMWGTFAAAKVGYYNSTLGLWVDSASAPSAIYNLASTVAGASEGWHLTDTGIGSWTGPDNAEGPLYGAPISVLDALPVRLIQETSYPPAPRLRWTYGGGSGEGAGDLGVYYSAGPVTTSFESYAPGEVIHYTLDGSTPTNESTVSVGGIVLGSWVSAPIVVKAIAVNNGIASEVSSILFMFTAQAPMVSLQLKPESGYFFSEAESRKPRVLGASGKGIFAGTIQWELLDSEWPMFLDWWEDKHKGVNPFNIYCCTGAEPLLHTFQAVGPYEVVRDTGVRKVTLPVKITMRPTGLYSGWGSFLGGPPVAYPVFVPMPQWGFQREEAAVFLSTTGAPTAARPVATRGELLSLEWKALTGMQFDVLVDWWSTYLGQGRRKFTISLPGETGPLLCQLVEDPAFTVEGVHFRGSMKVFAAPVRTLAPPPA